MKRYKPLLENFNTEENEIFKLENPNIKPKWVTISKEMIEKSKKWFNHNTHTKDIQSMNYWNNKNIKEYPPIIIHIYSGRINIIDGWHRLYSAIQNKNNKILAYVK